MSVMHLRADDFCGSGAFHVASVDSARLRAGVGMHDHDFYEVMYVHRGTIQHVMPDRTELCRPGDIVFVRPPDVHSVQFRPGKPALIVNVAFRAEIWRGYCTLAGINPDRPWPAELTGPLSHAIPSESLGACAELFERAKQAYIARPSVVDLFHFWSGLLLGIDILSRSTPGAYASAPAWLQAACRAMDDAENLQIGVPRLVEIAGVTNAHVVRTMRQALGVTPTEYVLERRLQRAAGLLSSSNAAIAEVALDCGFENLSYFYRGFRRRFATTPRRYRALHSRAIIA